ncbi:LacI family DNA-binding transcriptional regulator [Dactylosporangium maewongense]|uniref:LacI family DNA-binding transcriptional regulator n=1 Tax=Dactylosporangium maewongense TaxID=634393 RepID=A0ABP4PD66_9ACTN
MERSPSQLALTSARRPTIIDVARRAEVSKSVVSRVFSERGKVSAQTRQRVLDAAAELGYVVNAMARAMVAHRTYTLGVFVRDVATPFYGHLLSAMQERADTLGYRVVTATGSGRFAVEDELRALETLVMMRVEGLVIGSGLLPAAQILPFAERVPTVVAGRPETEENFTSVYCDEREGGAALADHLADLGHRYVAVITLRKSESLTLAPRTAAMVQELRRRGVEAVRVIGRGVDAADRWVDQILERPEVTAVMAPSDRYAVRLLEELQRRGVDVPARLSVTGYDGIGELATPLIGLTHWRQPIDAIGRSAVDALVALLDSGPPGRPKRHVLSGTLVLGRSTAPPCR